MFYRRALAEELLGLARTLCRLQRTADAIETFKESIAVAESALQAEPDSACARNLLAQGLGEYGSLLAEGNRAEDAHPLVRRASEIQEGLVQEHPEAFSIEAALVMFFVRSGVPKLRRETLRWLVRRSSALWKSDSLWPSLILQGG